MNPDTRPLVGTVSYARRAYQSPLPVDVLWLRNQPVWETRLGVLRKVQASSVRLAAGLAVVSIPLAAAAILLPHWHGWPGRIIPRPIFDRLLPVATALSVIGLACTVAVVLICRVAILGGYCRGRFQPIHGDSWRPRRCPRILWCGRYGVLGSMIALQLEEWTYDGAWRARPIGAADLADPEDSIAIGEARARLEARAAVEAGTMRAIQAKSEADDERRRAAAAMANTLAT